MEIIAALLGLAAEQSAINSQQNLGYASLNETKRANRKQEQLATASRTDAYGNRIYYVPGLGWQIDTTPTTKSILDAEQSETLASLREDAPRNRAAAVRRDERSKSADEEFEKAFNNYRYRHKPSEGEFIADNTQTRLNARRQGLSEASSLINKQLLRTGNSSNIAGVLKEADELFAGSLEDALLQGKRGGRQDFLQYTGALDGRDQQELAFLEGIASGTTTSPVRFTNTNQELSGQADQALQTLLATLSAGEGARSQATNALMATLGQTPDFGALAAALSNMGQQAATGGGKTVSPGQPGYVFPRPYEEGQRARLRADF